MQKKVVITIGSLDAGGCERRLHRILQQVRIHDIDLDFTFFIVSGRRGQLDDEYESLGATIRYGRPGVAGLVDLWRLCREVQPDVLHVNGQLASGVYCLAGLLAGVRNRVSFLATVGRGRPVAFDPMSSILHAMLTRALSTQVVGVADATRKYSLVPDRKWKTIYSGVNLPNLTNRKLDGYPSERLNILVLGRSDPQKNHYRALKIFSNLINSGVDAHLHFVGLRTDVRMAELCVEIKRMGIADRMTAHGYSSNVYSHIESSDVMLLPSINEGLPGVVLEALSCGLPVVATNLGGVKEIADRTAGVTTVPLEADDTKWVEAILEAKDESRAAIRASFASSPFLIDKSFGPSVALWTGEEEKVM